MSELLIGVVLVVLSLNLWLLHSRITTLERHAYSVGEGVKVLLREKIGPQEPEK